MTQSQKTTTILALDTCTEACSAALIYDGHIFADYAEVPREHSQRLLPMVDSVLNAANISLKEVNYIAYGRGPGSFTGIRICTSMTQGLALGAQLPVVGVSTLATMAQIAISQGASQVFAAIDARMGEVYWGQYQSVNGMAELIGVESVSCPKDILLNFNVSSPIMCVGTGFDVYPSLVNLLPNMLHQQHIRLPDAKAMLVLAERDIELGLVTSVDELEPTYLRNTVTWKKLPGRE